MVHKNTSYGRFIKLDFCSSHKQIKVIQVDLGSSSYIDRVKDEASSEVKVVEVNVYWDIPKVDDLLSIIELYLGIYLPVDDTHQLNIESLLIFVDLYLRLVFAHIKL
jgi:hypothetical protein